MLQLTCENDVGMGLCIYGLRRFIPAPIIAYSSGTHAPRGQGQAHAGIYVAQKIPNMVPRRISQYTKDRAVGSSSEVERPLAAMSEAAQRLIVFPHKGRKFFLPYFSRSCSRSIFRVREASRMNCLLYTMSRLQLFILLSNDTRKTESDLHLVHV